MIEPAGQTPTTSAGQGAVTVETLLSPASPDAANKGPGKGKVKAPPPPPADDGGSSDTSVDSNATNVTWDENDPTNVTSGKKPERRLITAKVRMYAARTKSSLKLMHLEF